MNVIDYFNREYNGRPSTYGVDLALKRLTAQPLNTLNDFDIWDSATCKFCKTPGNEDYFAVANDAGNAAIVDTKDKLNSDLIPEIELKAHDNAIFDLDWSDCDNRLLMGSGDRTASLWDFHEGELTKINDFAAHTRSLRTVAFRPQQKDVFASGGRDGLIVIWDARSASPNVLDVHTKPENVIQNVKLSKKKDASAFSICSVLFQDSVHLFSCGISEACVDVWDIRKTYSFKRRTAQPLYKLSHDSQHNSQHCYTSLCVDSSRTRLYANCRDGKVYQFNVASYSPQPVGVFNCNRTVSSNYVQCCLSPDDEFLLSGSSDGDAYMWRTRRPGTPCCARLKFNANEVSVVDWSRSSETKIITSSDLCDTEPGCCGDSSQDLMVLLWRVPDEPTNDECHECDECDYSDESDESSSSQPSYEFAAIQWIEETKHASNRRCFRACRPLVNKRPAITEVNSPTVNLPNHVIDGTSPLHRCSPHSRKEKENRNWLSSLKKKTPSSLNAKSTPSSHHAKTPSSLNPKSLQIRKSQSTSKKPKACGNLLKFFKAAAKENTPGATPLPLDSVPEVGNFAESSLMNGVAMMDI